MMWKSLQKIMRLPTRHRDLLRPRVHRSRTPRFALTLEPEQPGAGQPRQGGRPAARRRTSRRCRRASTASWRPTRSCARTSPPSEPSSACCTRPIGTSSPPSASARTRADMHGRAHRRRCDRASSISSRIPRAGTIRETFRDDRGDGRARRIDGDLLPAGARARSRAGIASMRPRCGTGTPGAPLALSMAPPDGDAVDDSSRRRPRGRRAPAGRRAARLLAERAQPRRLDARRLHGGAGLPVRALRAGGRRIFSAATLRCCASRPAVCCRQAHNRFSTVYRAAHDRLSARMSTVFYPAATSLRLPLQARLTKKSLAIEFHGHAGGCRL